MMFSETKDEISYAEHIDSKKFSICLWIMKSMLMLKTIPKRFDL